MDEIFRTLRFEEAEQWLNDVADELPPELFRELNGGIVLLPGVVVSPHGKGLYTLGDYHHDPYGLGRYIRIHYGSFVQVYGRESVARQKRELRTLLRHELTHHIESLAGVRDLEAKDEAFLASYNQKKPRRGGA